MSSYCRVGHDLNNPSSKWAHLTKQKLLHWWCTEPLACVENHQPVSSESSWSHVDYNALQPQDSLLHFFFLMKTGSPLKWANPKCDQQGPLLLRKTKSRRTIGWRMIMRKFDADNRSSHPHIPGASCWFQASSQWLKKLQVDQRNPCISADQVQYGFS